MKLIILVTTLVLSFAAVQAHADSEIASIANFQAERAAEEILLKKTRKQRLKAAEITYLGYFKSACESDGRRSLLARTDGDEGVTIWCGGQKIIEIVLPEKDGGFFNNMLFRVVGTEGKENHSDGLGDGYAIEAQAELCHFPKLRDKSCDENRSSN